MAQTAQHLDTLEQPRESDERTEVDQRQVPRSGPERKRRMSAIIARIAERDREILAQLAR